MRKQLAVLTLVALVSILPLTVAQAADSPVVFSTSAKGDLKDLDKDLGDLLDAIAKGSTFRLITNSAELSFNIGQLESLDPPASVASAWKQQFGSLQKAIKAVQAAISNDSSVSSMKSKIAAAKRQIVAVNKVIANVK